MPTVYYDYSDGIISSGTWVITDPIVSDSINRVWEEWLRECEQAEQVRELKMGEAAELARDRKNSPLFFWRETCSK